MWKICFKPAFWKVTRLRVNIRDLCDSHLGAIKEAI
jgi:hypothetical protein